MQECPKGSRYTAETEFKLILRCFLIFFCEKLCVIIKCLRNTSLAQKCIAVSHVVQGSDLNFPLQKDNVIASVACCGHVTRMHCIYRV